MKTKLTIIALFAVALAGCGGGSNRTENEDLESRLEAAEAAAKQAQEEKEAADLKAAADLAAAEAEKTAAVEEAARQAEAAAAAATAAATAAAAAATAAAAAAMQEAQQAQQQSGQAQQAQQEAEQKLTRLRARQLVDAFPGDADSIDKGAPPLDATRFLHQKAVTNHGFIGDLHEHEHRIIGEVGSRRPVPVVVRIASMQPRFIPTWRPRRERISVIMIWVAD